MLQCLEGMLKLSARIEPTATLLQLFELSCSPAYLSCLLPAGFQGADHPSHCHHFTDCFLLLRQLHTSWNSCDAAARLIRLPVGGSPIHILFARRDYFFFFPKPALPLALPMTRIVSKNLNYVQVAEMACLNYSKSKPQGT